MVNENRSAHLLILSPAPKKKKKKLTSVSTKDSA